MQNQVLDQFLNEEAFNFESDLEESQSEAPQIDIDKHVIKSATADSNCLHFSLSTNKTLLKKSKSQNHIGPSAPLTIYEEL